MRIHNKPIVELQKAYQQQKKVQDQRQGVRVPKEDGLQLSDTARLFGVAMQALRQEPEVERKELAPLKDAVQSGNYQVSNEAVAEKIWQEGFFDQQV